MTEPLIPPDREQCQTMIKKGSPFRIGDPIRWERCSSKPVAIISENKPGTDGQIGSMSVCKTCHAEAQRTMPPGHFTTELL